VAARVGVKATIMIDASHANSGKKPENQPLVIEDVCRQIEAGDERVIGMMVESNLLAGRQDPVAGVPLIYGRSITDGCIDWEKSVAVLQRLARAVEIRRRRRRG
jgi:3-deoxy-7-phosphoheptulonate synthase